MRKYTIWHALVYSFFSADFYRNAARNWRVLSFLSVALATILSIVPFVVRIDVAVSRFLSNEAKGIVARIPELRLRNGRLTTPENRPYLIRVPEEKGRLLCVIDTSGRYRTLEDADAPILLTAERAFLRKSDNETRIYDLKNTPDRTITRDDIERWIGIFRRWYLFFLVPFAFFIVYFYRLFQALFFSFVALLLNALMKGGQEYEALFSLTLLALIPLILGTTLVDLIDPTKQIPWYISLSAVTGYLAFGLKSLRDGGDGRDSAEGERSIP